MPTPVCVGPPPRAASVCRRTRSQVAEGTYSQIASWSRFHISPDFFLRTTTGRKLLYLEADTTNHERSLSLSARSTDLTMADASQAFRLIEAAARRMLSLTGQASPSPHPHLAKGASARPPAKPRALLRTLRVVLGDPRQCESSGSRRRDLRTRISKLGEADVLVDSQASVLEAVLRWCAHVGAPPLPDDGPSVRDSDAEREAAHAAAEEIAEMAEEAAEAAAARAAARARAAVKAKDDAADEAALAMATAAAAAQDTPMPGNSVAADTAVSAVMSARKAARAEADAEEATILAAVAEASEAAAWVAASQLPARAIVFETDSAEYCAEVQAVMRRFGVSVMEEVDAEALEEELAEAVSASASASAVASSVIGAARARAEAKAAEGMSASASSPKETAVPRRVQKKLERLMTMERELPAPAARTHVRLPRLIYYSSTSETVNVAQSLIRSGVADPTRCCAILDKHEGVHMLRDLVSPSVVAAPRQQQPPPQQDGDGAPIDVVSWCACTRPRPPSHARVIMAAAYVPGRARVPGRACMLVCVRLVTALCTSD